LKGRKKLRKRKVGGEEEVEKKGPSGESLGPFL
jgi:hypothetical protein